MYVCMYACMYVNTTFHRGKVHMYMYAVKKSKNKKRERSPLIGKSIEFIHFEKRTTVDRGKVVHVCTKTNIKKQKTRALPPYLKIDRVHILLFLFRESTMYKNEQKYVSKQFQKKNRERSPP